jgi:hypothetical protein
MNQIEQWFGILQRKQLRIPDFADKSDLTRKLAELVEHWNRYAYPFKWTTKSVAEIMAKCEAPIRQAH